MNNRFQTNLSLKETLPCSVIIIKHGRDEHLKSVIQALSINTVHPAEVIIVRMDDDAYVPCAFGLNIQYSDISFVNGKMPLAAARNQGASIAEHDILMFLDIDCIPDFRYVECSYDLIRKVGGLHMASPLYLQRKLDGPLLFDNLYSLSIPHPARPYPDSSIEICQVYELFWSLCYTIRKIDFYYTGGFDERYVGYGGEDTDFAKNAEKLGLPFYLTAQKVFHQAHEVNLPPVNHCNSIVNNSNLYHMKWGVWPMEDWLGSFDRLGLIDWKDTQNHPISILKESEKAHHQVETSWTSFHAV